MFKRIVLIVLDGVGCGALPDANRYGDQGANTLGHVAQAVGSLELPCLQGLGLGNIVPISGVPPRAAPRASWGRMGELSAAKDSTTGHWEIAGVAMPEPFTVYAQGFPAQIMREFRRIAATEALGNIAASGTEIIQQLGPEHLRTGRPIVYTSTDSVFQIAAHEEIMPVEQLYAICAAMRNVLDDYRVGRVIARPFVGTAEDGFVRTSRRRDFSMPPPQPTMLDYLQKQGIDVWAVGKIADIFCGRGIDRHISTTDNADGMYAIAAMLQEMERGLVFANLIDFDMVYGHRRDARGFAAALKTFDAWLENFLTTLRHDDLLLITADHGCDPCMSGTDHTREYVPLLAYTPMCAYGVDLGVRATFADIAATLMQNFNCHASIETSFLCELSRGASPGASNCPLEGSI